MSTIKSLYGFIACKTLNYFALQSFGFECTWWRSLQKQVLRTKVAIHDFIIGFLVFNTTFTYMSDNSWPPILKIGEYPEKTTNFPQVADKLYHIEL